ncbi:chromogranin-A isoform X1 [Podarcis muralis]
MTRTVLLAVLLLAAQVLSLPVTNPATKDDTKVMNCIVEVISDIVSKPNPLPISQECLETLQGDERILSILRHQNLLKELQEIAVQGASERTEQQKKSSGFEDELSEVLESQSNRNMERDLSEGTPDEEPTASFAELEAERSQKNSERDVSKEEERNSVEERETRARDVDSEEQKENAAGFDGNEVGETEGLPWDNTVDNHIHDEAQDDEAPQQRRQEGEEEEERKEDDEVVGVEGEEKGHISKNSQEESEEEGEDSVRDQAEEEEEEEEEEEKDGEEEDEEEEREASEEERPTSSEDKDDQREDDNQDAKEFDRDGQPSEEQEKFRSTKGGRHHTSRDETMQDEDTSLARDAESEEVEEDPSKGLEDAKRWNKMDELAKQLSTTKRAEESESNEDPDRSMKLALRSHKQDFRTSEEDMRRAQKHHSKEESSEGAFPLAALPEEKKDEEGSANRRTEGIAKTLMRHQGGHQKTMTTVAQVPVAEQKPSSPAQQKDQELESLAAIEAELEKVAHKLHALRRG